MSTELIIILSVLGLGGLIGLFYVSHAIEKQRRQKALMIANLSDYAFRLQRLLDFIPAAYLSKEVRLLLLNQIKKRMEKLIELAPDNEKFAKKLDSCNTQIADIQSTSTPPSGTTTENTGRSQRVAHPAAGIIQGDRVFRAIESAASSRSTAPHGLYSE